MKKSIIFFFIAAFITSITVFTACQKKEQITTVRLNEVVHSIFYAPQYVALEKGFFEEQGLKIELDVGQGADKTMTALVSGNADIGLMGTEASIYVYNEGKEDYAVSFAQLTQRAGNFLVSRTDDKNFQWSDVVGKTIIGGRAGGMPQMVLEYVLKKNNIVIGKDVEIVTNLQFTSTSGAFVGGIGDYTAEFDPSAFAIEQQGAGFVVASLGVDSGKVPYTVYMATKNYMAKNPEIIQKFTNAIYKGQLWVASHSAEEIAQVVAPHFADMTAEDLTFMVNRYKSQETWKDNPIFDEESLELIQDIMESGGELAQRVPYKDLINTDFAKKAMETVK